MGLCRYWPQSMTREKALLEKKSPAEASPMVYPGVRGLESDPTLHPEYEHKQAPCVLQVLLGAWHRPTRDVPATPTSGSHLFPPLPFPRALVAPMVECTCSCVRNGSRRLPLRVCTLRHMSNDIRPQRCIFSAALLRRKEHGFVMPARPAMPSHQSLPSRLWHTTGR